MNDADSKKSSTIAGTKTLFLEKVWDIEGSWKRELRDINGIIKISQQNLQEKLLQAGNFGVVLSFITKLHTIK